MATLTLKDIGPVENVTIEVPESGVAVLRARNGMGKSIALDAVEAMVSGQGGAPVRDGQTNGEVSGFGAVMRVGRRTSRLGELLVTSLEGRLSPADLVDPGIDNPEAADAKRIKALVQLAGVSAEPALFYGVTGGKEAFDELVPDLKETNDVLQMATQVKRSLEARARLVESQAEGARGKAKAHAEAASSIDPAIVTDATALQDALEEALQDHARLKGLHEQGLDVSMKASKARHSLAAYTGQLTPDRADELEREAADSYEAAKVAVRDCETTLADLRLEMERGKSAWNKAIDAKRHAESQAKLVDAWKSAIAESEKAFPGPEEVAEAAAVVESARKDVEAGVLARHAQDEQLKAAEARHAADALEAEARRLRDAAGEVDGVLSSLVGKLGIDLKVWAGRLVLETKRGRTYYGDLSHGERWIIAIDLCVDVIGTNGVIVVPQESWEGLDPENRQKIAAHAKKRGVLILTAEASDDEEITTEVY